MRRIFLMSSVLFVAPFMFGETGEASAQCVATTDCASLGYTEASCPNGGIKCPFGSNFACPATDQSVCEKYGFKYDCKGTGYTTGIGQTCNNKYTSCTCTSGYEWKSGKCEKVNTPSNGTLGTCTGYAKNCSIGDILNSDGTCTTDKVSGKTPIGVVVYISSAGCGQAVTLEPSSFGELDWHTSHCWTYCPVDKSYSSVAEQSCKIIDKMGSDLFKNNYKDAMDDFKSCENTQRLNKINNETKSAGYTPYTTAAVIEQFTPTNALETKGKWCLPAAGVYLKIQDNYDLIVQKMKSYNFSTSYIEDIRGTIMLSSTIGNGEIFTTYEANSYYIYSSWGWFPTPTQGLYLMGTMGDDFKIIRMRGWPVIEF